MKVFIKKMLRLILGKEFWTRIQDRKGEEGLISYSQEGEDRLLANIFREKQSGFYVDVGSHHPHFLSNTHLFYRSNWRGINIDANPDCMEAFMRHRPKDININAGVGNTSGVMLFYNFEEPALSSFDSRLSLERESQGRKIRSKIKIQVRPLRDLLQESLPKGTNIDFMSVDVEGLDLDVLKSNDWKKFRPKILLVECLDLNIENLKGNEICDFLEKNGYKFCSKLINTCFFMDDVKA